MIGKSIKIQSFHHNDKEQCAEYSSKNQKRLLEDIVLIIMIFYFNLFIANISLDILNCINRSTNEIQVPKTQAFTNIISFNRRALNQKLRISTSLGKDNFSGELLSWYCGKCVIDWNI